MMQKIMIGLRVKSIQRSKKLLHQWSILWSLATKITHINWNVLKCCMSWCEGRLLISDNDCHWFVIFLCGSLTLISLFKNFCFTSPPTQTNFCNNYLFHFSYENVWNFTLSVADFIKYIFVLLKLLCLYFSRNAISITIQGHLHGMSLGLMSSVVGVEMVALFYAVTNVTKLSANLV